MRESNVASAANRFSGPIARSIALRREAILRTRALQRQVRQLHELAWSMRRHVAAAHAQPSGQTPSDDDG